MDTQTFTNYTEKNKLLTLIGLVLCVFIIALVVATGVDVKNKLKEGKYIGRNVEINTINVSGTGEVYAKPDLGIVNVSVVSEAKTVATAMTDNTKKMNAIVDFVKKMGVEDKDLKTTSFYISPLYEWSQQTTCFYPPCPSGERTLTGYEITQQLEIKIRDLTKVGDIIQGATVSGANQVGDLQFTIDKPDDVKKQAREEAIKKAKEKAKELASQLGVKLIRITNFSESGDLNYPQPVYMASEALGKGGGETAPSVQDWREQNRNNSQYYLRNSIKFITINLSLGSAKMTPAIVFN